MNPDRCRELKSRMRREIIEARSLLSKVERAAKDAAICEKLVAAPGFAEAGLIMAYMDFRDETGTSGILEECFKRGKRVALPVMSGDGAGSRDLQVFEITRRTRLLENRYGIREPDPGTSARVGEHEVDIVIAPGVAFDPSKHRLGYGAGYYDRFLARLRPDCLTVGIAYEAQIVEAVPAEKHDMLLDMIITECRIIK